LEILGDERDAERVAGHERDGADLPGGDPDVELADALAGAALVADAPAHSNLGSGGSRYLIRKPTKIRTSPAIAIPAPIRAWRCRICIATEAPVGDESRTPPPHAR